MSGPILVLLGELYNLKTE